MPLLQTDISLGATTPNAPYSLCVYEIGEGEKRVYLQAALHADEQPGTMVLHHLIPRLVEADQLGLLNAQFTIIPMANPIGLSQIRFQQHQGRYFEGSGVNFNRQWPRLFPLIEDELAHQLTDNAEQNVLLIRRLTSNVISAFDTASAFSNWRRTLLTYASEADVILDLHCDNDSLIHIFTAPQCSEPMRRLGDYIGADGGVLTAEDSGGGSFDEIFTLLWADAQRAFPNAPIPLNCIAATLEYRGRADVFDSFGIQDAAGLLNFFIETGYIEKTPSFKSAERKTKVTPFNATEIIRTRKAGLLAYKVELGQRVLKGDVIADLIAIDGDNAFVERTPITTATDGIVISRQVGKYAWVGSAVAKIVGEKPLNSRGSYLLED